MKLINSKITEIRMLKDFKKILENKKRYSRKYVSIVEIAEKRYRYKCEDKILF